MEANLIYKTVEYNGISIKASIMSPQDPPLPDALFLLHGGGLQADMQRFSVLRSKLCSMNIETIAFDFIGHGVTGGDLFTTSLFDRTKQALAVMRFFNRENCSILGTSMSAYIAIHLTQYVNVKKLILSVPAIYSRHVFKVPFGKEFSAIIRQKDSWIDSDAWDICENYKGKVLIITAQNDDVIPKEIPTILNKKFTKAFILTNLSFDCGHQILPYINNNPIEVDRLAIEIHKLF